MTYKTCTKCKKEYPATNKYFYKMKDGKNGLNPRCKNCVNDLNENERYKYKKYIKEYYQQYYQDNKEKLDKKNKQWKEYNLEKVKIYAKKCYFKYRKKRLEESKKYTKLYKKELNEYYRKNFIIINNIHYNLKTCEKEIKPIIQGLIALRHKNKFLKDIKNG